MAASDQISPGKRAALPCPGAPLNKTSFYSTLAGAGSNLWITLLCELERSNFEKTKMRFECGPEIHKIVPRIRAAPCSARYLREKLSRSLVKCVAFAVASF